MGRYRLEVDRQDVANLGLPWLHALVRDWAWANGVFNVWAGTWTRTDSPASQRFIYEASFNSSAWTGRGLL